MHNYSIISGKNLSSFFGCRQGKMREKKKRGLPFTRGFLGTGGRGSAVFYSALQRAPVHIPPFFIRRYSERRYAYRRCLFGATASAGTKSPEFFSLSLKARNYHCKINFYAIHKSYLEVTTPDLNSGQETIGDFVYSGKEKLVRPNFQYRLAEHGGLPLRWFLLSQQR